MSSYFQLGVELNVIKIRLEYRQLPLEKEKWGKNTEKP